MGHNPLSCLVLVDNNTVGAGLIDLVVQKSIRHKVKHTRQSLHLSYYPPVLDQEKEENYISVLVSL